MRISFLSLSLLLTIAVTAVVASAADRRDSLTDRLKGAYTAYREADQDLQWRINRSLLGEADIEDYRAYVAMLGGRVKDACDELTSAGFAPPHGIDCADFSADRDQAAAAATAAPRPKTRVETVDDLDAQLRASLGEFDDRLLQEEREIKADAPVRAGADAAQSGGGGQADAASGAQSAGTGPDQGGREGTEGGPPGSAPGRPGGVGGGGGAGTTVGKDRPGRGGGSGPGAVPQKPPADEDDAVARQLREAAERETDPELKKKLWEEYERYKKGTG